MEALRKAGVIVAKSPAEIGLMVQRALQTKTKSSKKPKPRAKTSKKK